MLQPYWSPTVSNKYAKGSIIGFGDIHTRAHIYRAIFEGICFELHRMQEIVQGRTFVPNPQSHRIYTQMFNDVVYKKSFRTLEPIYHRIAQITGYPAED
jgi:sugar (pentulose or hexulose) kinase